MYKVTYQENQGSVSILQVTEEVKGSWVLVKDKDTLEDVEKVFFKNRKPRSTSSLGYGEAVYTDRMVYVSDKFEVVG